MHLAANIDLSAISVEQIYVQNILSIGCVVELAFARAIVKAVDACIIGCHLIEGSETFSIAAMLEAICDTFLPGKSPLKIEGDEASSQIVEPSTSLLFTRSFRDAMLDIRTDWAELCQEP